MSVKEIKLIIKALMQRKLQVQVVSLVNTISHLRKKTTPVLQKPHQKIEEKGTIPDLFHKASITLIPKYEISHYQNEEQYSS